MKVTFWARLQFAEARVTEHLMRVRGASVDLPRWIAHWDGHAEQFRARTAPFRLYA